MNRSKYPCCKILFTCIVSASCPIILLDFITVLHLPDALSDQSSLVHSFLLLYWLVFNLIRALSIHAWLLAWREKTQWAGVWVCWSCTEVITHKNPQTPRVLQKKAGSYHSTAACLKTTHSPPSDTKNLSSKPGLLHDYTTESRIHNWFKKDNGKMISEK